MRSALIGLVLWLSACLPTAPDGSYRFVPPSEFKNLYADVALCSNLFRPYKEIRWHVVPSDGPTFVWDGMTIMGLWMGPRDIYLPSWLVEEPADIASNPWSHEQWVMLRNGVAKHEMQHYLIGYAGHPKPPYCSCAPMYVPHYCDA